MCLGDPPAVRRWLVAAAVALLAGLLSGSGAGLRPASAALLSDTSWAADCQKFSLSERIEVGREKAGNIVELHIRHNVKVRTNFHLFSAG